MNVLMNCLSSVSGGAVSILRNLSPLLAARFAATQGEHKLIFLAHESQQDLFTGVLDEHCHWIGGKRLTGWRRVVWEHRNLDRIVSETGAEVVFTPYQIAASISGVKQVLMLCNMEPFLFMTYPYSPRTRLRNHLLRWQSSHALRKADRIIAVSGFAEEQMRNGLGIASERIHRIYHGRDTAFSPIGDLDEDRVSLKAIGVEGDFLLTCGSVLPYRRYEDVIAAFNQCASLLNDEIKLVIAGSGNDVRYAEKIRREISKSPYRDRILAVGHVKKETMTVLFRRCLMCIIATEIEACPNIAIEAMSSGCPIISSDRPPLPEIFGGSSLEFTSRNIEEMVDRICSCLHDATLRSEMGKRALDRSRAFSWQKCAEETYSALIEWPKE